MKEATDSIAYFLLISCLIHALALWGLDVKRPATGEQRLAHTIRFVFDKIIPPADRSIQPVTPTKKKNAISKRQKKPVNNIKKEQHAPPQVCPRMETTPSGLTKDEPPAERIEEVRPSPALALKTSTNEQTVQTPASKTEEFNRLKQNILGSYLSSIRAMLERNKNYPAWAKRNNWEGTVQLRFVILKDGVVEDVTIVNSSGFSVLDEAAECTVKRVARFPSIPKELAMNRLPLDVPLVFRLVNR